MKGGFKPPGTCLCCPAGDGCGPSVLGPSSGTLSSLGYPGTYPNNTVCEWEISVPRGKRIHFCFAELDIEDSDCQVNYLRLYNGVGPERSEIGELIRGVSEALADVALTEMTVEAISTRLPTCIRRSRDTYYRMSWYVLVAGRTENHMTYSFQ